VLSPSVPSVSVLFGATSFIDLGMSISVINFAYSYLRPERTRWPPCSLCRILSEISICSHLN
jgi:hypothetical protein